MPYLCGRCHGVKEFTQRERHGPVIIGMCMSCHQPHQSDEEKLLTETVPGLCYQCHRESKFSQKFIHPPVQAG
ncbi:MAG: cytochrome c3 family protein, partial [Gammaproteobacteria bacterium]|nr:cytochrome c3 family protein [Gammaproteobacteria bacterium]